MTTSYFGQSRTQRGRLLGSIVETQNFRDGLESGPSGSWAAIPAGLITGLEDGDKALRVDAGKSVYLQNVSGGYVQKGETMLVHFKVSGTGPQAVLALQTGSGALFTRWGLMYSGGKIYRQKVVNDTTPVTTNTEIIASAPADKWYVAQISVWAAGQDFVLHVWQRDAAGADQLKTLEQAGVGALYLGNVASPFTVKTASGQTQGQVRSTGVFLTESGQAGTLQQVDL